MTDLQSTLDAIDAATAPACGWCCAPLGPGSPSDLFCGPDHQDLYMERQGEALVGYRESSDLPQHVYNLVEDASPETAPRRRRITIRCDTCWGEWDDQHSSGRCPAIREYGSDRGSMASMLSAAEQWLEGRQRDHRP